MNGLRPRTVRGRLVGLAAAFALLVLLLGIPAALLKVAGNPLAAGLPSWQDLLSPDDGSLFLTVLVLVGWLAWASFAISVLVEAAATLRGRPAPHLPALHVQQRAAAGLIGAAALLFSLGGPAMASAAATVPATVGQTSTAAATGNVALPAQAGGASTTTRASAASSVTRATTAMATVQGPTHIVTDGESLWSIAEQHLGDGARFNDIARLNYAVPQPDGSALTNSHWIRPGWTLRLPATPSTATLAAQPATAEHLRTVRAGDTMSRIAQAEYGDPTGYTPIAQASRHIVQPNGTHLTNPDVIDVGWTLRIPAATGNPPATGTVQPPPAPPGPSTLPAAGAPSVPSAAPAAPLPATPLTSAPSTTAKPSTTAPETAAPGAAAPSAATSPAPHHDHLDQGGDDQGIPVRTTAGVGALLAAGVLTLLATRRSAQQRRRRHGRTLPLPQGESAAFETDLRSNADPLSVETVDNALRALAVNCATARQPLPAVRAARLTAGQFDLYLAEPATLPSPWAGTADATAWSLPAGTDPQLNPDDAAQVTSPYPSLVTIGHDDEDGHVLLDLEHLGALGVSGDPDRTREILAAIAVELATSRWADDLQITLVGAYPELEDCLRTGRIRYLPAVGHLIDELTHRANRDRAALADDTAPDLRHARAAGTAPDTWTPEILLLAGQLNNQQRQQLQDLLHQLPRVAVAAVTSGEPLGEWAIQLRGDHAVLDPIGLQIRPQRITDHDYARMLDGFALADEDDETDAGEPASEPTLAELPAQAAAEPAAEQATGHPEPPATGPALVPAGAPPSRTNGSVQIHIVTGDIAAGAGPTQLIDLTATPPQQVNRPAAPQTTDDDATGSPAPAPTGPPLPTAPADERQPATPISHLEQTDTLDEPVLIDQAEPADDEAGPVVDRDGAASPLEPQSVDAKARPTSREPIDSSPDPDQDTRPAPRVLVLGPPVIVGARGVLAQDSHAPRLTELAAFLALRPDSRTEMIRDEVFSHSRTRPTNKTVTEAASRLRRWLGDQGQYLPAAKHGHFGFGPAVTSDWGDWQTLLPNGAKTATTEALQQALALVRHQPLAGSNYRWADHDVQLLTAQIVDAAYELARRQLIEGRYQAVLQTATKGLLVEGSMERLWRLKILAAHATGNTAIENDAISRLLRITELLGGDLEPESRQLLADLRDPTASRIDQLTAQAL